MHAAPETSVGPSSSSSCRRFQTGSSSARRLVFTRATRLFQLWYSSRAFLCSHAVSSFDASSVAFSTTLHPCAPPPPPRRKPDSGKGQVQCRGPLAATRAPGDAREPRPQLVDGVRGALIGAPLPRRGLLCALRGHRRPRRRGRGGASVRRGRPNHRRHQSAASPSGSRIRSSSICETKGSHWQSSAPTPPSAAWRAR